jgi:hypothetical protein
MLKRKEIIAYLYLALILGCGDPEPSVLSYSELKNDQFTQFNHQKNNAVTLIDSAPSTFSTFTVYADKESRLNHYIPSGFMPNGKCVALNDTWREDCHTGASCIRIVYGIQCSKENDRWAGIYWQNPANNWGTRKGGFDLTGASKLTFWAKGENGGEQIQEFTVGGIQGNYPDSDTAALGPVVLTNEWRQYTIDLRGKDLTYISGGFGWTTNVEVNPETCIFYLDDIKFE